MRSSTTSLRSLGKCGRIVVLGRPPQDCANPRHRTAQRALEGLTRSLGKEARRGITANLVYVGEGAEARIEATLRFFSSPRSAYASGQVVHITADGPDSSAARLGANDGSSRGLRSGKRRSRTSARW